MTAAGLTLPPLGAPGLYWLAAASDPRAHRRADGRVRVRRRRAARTVARSGLQRGVGAAPVRGGRDRHAIGRGARWRAGTSTRPLRRLRGTRTPAVRRRVVLRERRRARVHRAHRARVPQSRRHARTTRRMRPASPAPASRDSRAAASAGDAEIWLRARNEGAGATRSAPHSSFRRTSARACRRRAFTSTGFVFERGVDIVAGAMLRLDHGVGARTLARVARVWEEWQPDARGDRAARVVRCADRAHRSLRRGAGRRRAGDRRRRRTHGAARRDSDSTPTHPRWLARVLVEESELLYPGENLELPAGDPRRTWDDGRDLVIDPPPPTYTSEHSRRRRRPDAAILPADNRYRDIVPDDFFDARGRSATSVRASGVHCARRSSPICRSSSRPISTRRGPSRRSRS